MKRYIFYLIVSILFLNNAVYFVETQPSTAIDMLKTRLERNYQEMIKSLKDPSFLPNLEVVASSKYGSLRDVFLTNLDENATSIELNCTDKGTNGDNLVWLNGWDEAPETRTNGRIRVGRSNVLKVDKLLVNDSGLYTCQDEDVERSRSPQVHRVNINVYTKASAVVTYSFDFNTVKCDQFESLIPFNVLEKKFVPEGSQALYDFKYNCVESNDQSKVSVSVSNWPFDDEDEEKKEKENSCGSNLICLLDSSEADSMENFADMTEMVMNVSQNLVLSDLKTQNLPTRHSAINLICPPGHILHGIFCVACVAGTYAPRVGANGCVECPKGSYQDLVGQEYCLRCDEEYTTEGNRSTSVEDCIFKDMVASDNSNFELAFDRRYLRTNYISFVIMILSALLLIANFIIFVFFMKNGPKPQRDPRRAASHIDTLYRSMSMKKDI